MGALVRTLSCRVGVGVAAVLAAGTVLSGAHTGGTTGFASITVRDNGVRYAVGLYPGTLPAPAAEMLRGALAGQKGARDGAIGLIRDKVHIAADGAVCAPGQGYVLLPDTEPDRVTVVVDFACARPVRRLELRDDTFDVLGADHHTLAKVEAGGAVHQLAFEPARREARVTLATPGAPSEGGASFFLMGVHHILAGWDHLLFLLALLLRGGTVLTLLKIVTAFTIAHSVTLALAVLGVVDVQARLVEPVIALSIAFVAAENLVPRPVIRARWAASFVFGLVHGFGFSAALRELAAPRAGLAASLLGFNLGVEAGQALVVAVAWPLLFYLGRTAHAPALARACSVTILVVGLALFLERVVVP